MSRHDELTLLTDGTAAFPEILRCIAAAERTIEINMFIWRADRIGLDIARALLAAADRGVRIQISIDRYGVVLEKCEESTHSFFHEKLTLIERIKITSLKCFYPALHPKSPLPPPAEHAALRVRMLTHPNITVSRDIFKADHSKYYVFDEKILILGGINIEDKENGCDLRGYAYSDYMVKLTGEACVSAFHRKMETGEDTPGIYRFRINSKTLSPHRFELREHYLDLIRTAERELTIVMAYVSPLDDFIRAILDAHRRGVRVTVMIPIHANFQDHINRQTVRRLLRESENGITVLLSPKMLHTKLIRTESTISLGSTNLTRKAFGQLSELNFVLDRTNSPFEQDLDASIRENVACAARVDRFSDIRFNRLIAAIEHIVV